jgi:hypothetical protein
MFDRDVAVQVERKLALVRRAPQGTAGASSGQGSAAQPMYPFRLYLRPNASPPLLHLPGITTKRTMQAKLGYSIAGAGGQRGQGRRRRVSPNVSVLPLRAHHYSSRGRRRRAAFALHVHHIGHATSVLHLLNGCGAPSTIAFRRRSGASVDARCGRPRSQMDAPWQWHGPRSRPFLSPYPLLHGYARQGLAVSRRISAAAAWMPACWRSRVAWICAMCSCSPSDWAR